MDLSGSPQGAGGVGGLLVEGDTSAGLWYATYDGNGNVSEYVSKTGATAAHYEYDAFGNTVFGSGMLSAPSFSCRFSTKALDLETGWYYYGFRYYDAVRGRWMNKDPMCETGGVNLYGMIGNDLVNRWDFLGLADVNWHHLLVQQFKDEFMALGINIDAKEFGWNMSVPDHSELHSKGWNKDWEDFFKKNGASATEKLVADQLKKMIEDPRFKDLLKNGSQSTSNYKYFNKMREAGCVVSEAVKNATSKIGGKTKNIAKGAGKVSKVIIPVTIYLSWCDCKAAGMDSTSATIYVAVDAVNLLPVSPPPEDFVGPWTDIQMQWEAIRGYIGRCWNSQF